MLARLLATTLFVVQSMRCAMLVVSEVLTSILPSGLTATPSGSTPTGNRVMAEREATSIAVNFILGRLILDAPRPSTKRAYLWIGALFNFGLLAYFKYTGFFISTAERQIEESWHDDDH